MLDRKIDEVATDLDDASTVVEELQNDPNVDADEQLDDLHEALENASDTIDDLENNDK